MKNTFTEKEATVESLFIRLAKKLNFLTYKFSSPTRGGVTDRILITPRGEVWFVEIKKHSGKLSPLQEEFKNDILTFKCNYALLKGRQEVEEFFTKFS